MSDAKKSFDDLEAVKLVVAALEKFNDDERKRIIRWSCEKLGSNYCFDEGKDDVGNLQVNNGEKNKIQQGNLEKITDIKTFVNSKKPANDSQFVAVMAYYYKFEAPESERKDFIISDDLNEAARLADRNRFLKPASTLNNVYSQSGFLDRIEVGKYKINSVGENLVAMVLPNKEGKKNIRKKKNNKKKKAGNKK